MTESQENTFYFKLKIKVLFFVFAECLELIKGRKQFDIAAHLKFDKFHHN